MAEENNWKSLATRIKIRNNGEEIEVQEYKSNPDGTMEVKDTGGKMHTFTKDCLFAPEWKICTKKPVEVEFREVIGEKEVIKTREGELVAYAGQDYIIRGVEGEVYPIKKDIFEKTYLIGKTEQTTMQNVIKGIICLLPIILGLTVANSTLSMDGFRYTSDNPFLFLLGAVLAALSLGLGMIYLEKAFD